MLDSIILKVMSLAQRLILPKTSHLIKFLHNKLLRLAVECKFVHF